MKINAQMRHFYKFIIRINQFRAKYFSIKHAFAHMKTKYLLLLLIGLPSFHWLHAQFSLGQCGVVYTDPQNVSQSDSFVYQIFFEDVQQKRNYFIDINAFAGQEVDRTYVYAILPDLSRKAVGALAFGACLDCTRGFTLMVDGETVVSSINNRNELEFWLNAFSQPSFTLTGNLQTLVGAGRISGALPLCAIGMEVTYKVARNPNNTATQFATQILCPQVVQNCAVALQAEVNCQEDLIVLRANVPDGCYGAEAQFRWYNKQDWSFEGRNTSLPLTGNNGWYYLDIVEPYCTFTDSVFVASNFAVNAGNNQVLCEGNTLLLGTTVPIDFQEIGKYWQSPDGNFYDELNVSINDVQTTQSGAYILTVLSPEGCVATDTVIITVNAPTAPELDMPKNLCFGDTIQLALVNQAAFSRYEWFNPANDPIAPIINNFSLAEEGNYQLVATDTSGCQISFEFDLFAKQSQDILTDIQSSCDTFTITLLPSDYLYEWSNGFVGNRFMSLPSATYEVLVTDENNCQSQITVLVPENRESSYSIKVTSPACPNDVGGTIEIVPIDNTVPTLYSIDEGKTYTISERFHDLAPGLYELIALDDNGCQEILGVEIEEPAPLSVQIIANHPLEVRPFTDILLSAAVVGNVQSYQWLPNEIDSESATTRFVASRDMDIRLVVQDDRNCKAVASIKLTIELGDIFIPNIFSPNGDGVNDVFTFFSDGQSGEMIEELRIFDRWGSLIFEAIEIPLNNLQVAWNGSNGNQMMPVGNYVYQGVVRFGNEVRKQFEGLITLSH
jgi:gliding motility-associated-like protein